MASPFRIFRKYQKTLLVLAGVALMVVFVLGDSLSAILRRLGSPGAPRGGMEDRAVAVRWDGGELTNVELNSLVMQRRILNDFLRGIEFAGRMDALDAGAEPQPLRVQVMLGAETPEQHVEQDVVRMKLFAEAARRAGMSVSDDNIKRYLTELGRGRVSAPQMRTILLRMRTAGRGTSIDYIFEALRQSMLAHNYLASYTYALETVTPEQRWQDWLRANDRIVVETAAVPVKSFLVNVPEPTDEQLATFFVTKGPSGIPYNEREPQPDFVANTELPSAIPGFAISRKVDLRFLLADYDQMLSKLEGEVTEDEIQDYYDANKDLFIRADSGMSATGGTSEESAAGAVQHAPADGQTEAAPSDDEPGATVPPAKTDDAAAAETSTSEAEPADTAAPSDGGTTAAPATGDSSQVRPSRANPFRLTALEQPADGENAESTGTEAAPAEGPAGTDATASAAANTASSESAAATSPAETPSTTPPAAGASAGEGGEGAAATASEPPVEYQPLSEVSDQIRRQLASQKVNEHLLDLMTRLKSQLSVEFSTYFAAVLDATAAGKEPPAPPADLADLSGLAKENGLEYGETGPVSLLDLREMPIGKSVDADTNEPLRRMMFSNEVELYQPVTTFDVDNNRYLVIKVSDTPRRVPELSDVRAEVVRAWKLQKAAELAEAHTKELATKIEQAGATLQDYFADESSVRVQRTDPFAWYTIGDVSRSGMVLFRLSEPEGIVAAGPEFMRTVFELGGDQVGAVLNNDHSIAYVVRVAEHQDTPAQLQKTYLAEADRWYGLRTMHQGRVQAAAAALGKSFGESVGIDWLRDPDQVRTEEE